MEFSPNERYLLTFSSKEPTHQWEKTEVTYQIFDARSGRKLRVFQGPVDEFSAAGGEGLPGVMKDE
jgi:translation initiation factor 3 subunit B